MLRLTNVLKNEEHRIWQLLLCFLFYVYIYIYYCCCFPINLLIQFDIIAVYFRFHITTIDLLLPIRFVSAPPSLLIATFALCTHTSIDNAVAQLCFVVAFSLPPRQPTPDYCKFSHIDYFAGFNFIFALNKNISLHIHTQTG